MKNEYSNPNVNTFTTLFVFVLALREDYNDLLPEDDQDPEAYREALFLHANATYTECLDEVRNEKAGMKESFTQTLSRITPVILRSTSKVVKSLQYFLRLFLFS